jgi:hypothetical protein
VGNGAAVKRTIELLQHRGVQALLFAGGGVAISWPVVIHGSVISLYLTWSLVIALIFLMTRHREPAEAPAAKEDKQDV